MARTTKPKPRTPKQPMGERKRKRQWARMGERTYVAEQLAQLHDDIDGARTDGSWQALAALYRQAMAMRERLDALDRAAAAADRGPELSQEELVRQLVEAVLHLPAALLEPVADALDQRLAPPAEVDE